MKTKTIDICLLAPLYMYISLCFKNTNKFACLHPYVCSRGAIKEFKRPTMEKEMNSDKRADGESDDVSWRKKETTRRKERRAYSFFSNVFF